MTYDPNRPLSYTSTERDLDTTADTSSPVEKAQDKAQQVASNIQDKAQDVKDKAQQVAGDVKDKAQQVSGQAVDRADAATTTVGAKMTDAAQTLRERAPVEGPMADAAEKTADTLERAGTYLQQQDLAGMKADLESLIRRHPMESLLVGLGIGYLLARSTRR